MKNITFQTDPARYLHAPPAILITGLLLAGLAFELVQRIRIWS
jgi:hypothetical protein